MIKRYVSTYMQINDCCIVPPRPERQKERKRKEKEKENLGINGLRRIYGHGCMPGYIA